MARVTARVLPGRVPARRPVADRGATGDCAAQDRHDEGRGQCATSVELDEIRPRPERDEQRGVGVVGHGPNLARGQRSWARHSHAAGMDRPEQRAPPAPLASGDDDYAVARLEAVLTEKLRPSGRLAGDLGVGETFDHAQRVDVRDRVAFAVLDRLEEVNREVRELRRWLALRPLDRPLA